MNHIQKKVAENLVFQVNIIDLILMRKFQKLEQVNLNRLKRKKICQLQNKNLIKKKAKYLIIKIENIQNNLN